MKYFAILLGLVVFCTLSFKAGDKHGYEDGFRYGYGMECKADLEQLKSIIQDQNKAMSSLQTSVQDYAHKRDSIVAQERIKQVNKIMGGSCKGSVGGGLIEGVNPDGTPILNEDKLKELAGLK